MADSEVRPEPDVLAAYVALQGQTPCRKCKGKTWTLAQKTRSVLGGDRVGIFVVLGKREERVHVISFTCNGCKTEFERPAYSREQLRTQQFPAIDLGGLGPEVDVKLEVRQPGSNGNGKAH
jgi:hypothetical protein